MFREMRLKEQQLSQEEAIAILKKATHGTLAINGEDKYPYSVPVSFAYGNGKIYFHGALAGQKYDLLTKNPSVCLSVVDLDDVQPTKFTTFYRSVIVYGDVKRLTTPEEISGRKFLRLRTHHRPYDRETLRVKKRNLQTDKSVLHQFEGFFNIIEPRLQCGISV